MAKLIYIPEVWRFAGRDEKMDTELRCPSTLCRSLNSTLTHDCNSRRDDV